MIQLEDLEPGISAIARRYSPDFHEREDLEQIARLKIFEVLEEKPDVPANYLYVCVENAFRNLRNKEKTQKRGGGKKPLSIHKYEEDEDSIGDLLIGSSDITPLEKIEFLKEFLRKNFGRTYLKNIKKHHMSFPRKIIRGLVEEVWKFDLEEIPKKVSYQLFVDSNMGNFLWLFYKNSPMKAIQDAYPDRFFKWEFNRVPNHFWDGRKGIENSLEAIKWLVKKYNINGDEKRMPVGHKEFEEEGLGRMLYLNFSWCTFLALKAVFPNLKRWQMQAVPNGFYDSESQQKIALESLLQDLGMPSFSRLSSEEIYDCNTRKIRKRDFEKKRLRGLLAKNNNSVYDVFNAIYPGKVYPWFFYGCHRDLGNPKEMAAKAIKWLFEDYLGIPKQEIPKYATNRLFWKAGFSGILTRRDVGLNSSNYAAVNLAYPGEFSRYEFERDREIKEIALPHDFRAGSKESKLLRIRHSAA